MAAFLITSWRPMAGESRGEEGRREELPGSEVLGGELPPEKNCGRCSCGTSRSESSEPGDSLLKCGILEEGEDEVEVLVHVG